MTIERLALRNPNACVTIDIAVILLLSNDMYMSMNTSNAIMTPSRIKSNIMYGISLGLNADIYPINITFIAMRMDKDATGSGQTATTTTNMNLRRYFNG